MSARLRPRAREGLVAFGPDAAERREAILGALWKLHWQAVGLGLGLGRTFVGALVVDRSGLSPREALETLGALAGERLISRQGERYGLTAAGLQAGYRVLRDADELPAGVGREQVPA